MLCTFCGTDNSPENKFCGMCGVRLERRKIERRVRHGTASMKCASCGHVCEPGTTFCGMCGARIERRFAERRAGEERATAVANVQLPSPEVPEKTDAPETIGSVAKPVPDTAAEAAAESESATAALPAEEIPGRPPAAIFRSAPAERPASAERSAPAKRSAIAGPSFLGLSDEPASPADYLLEEEKSSGNAVRILIVAVALAMVLGFVFVQWRPNLRAILKPSGSPKAAPIETPTEEQKPKPETTPAPEAATAPGVPEPSPSPAAAGASDKSPEVQPDSEKPSVAATPEPATETSKANSPSSDDSSTRAAKNAAMKEKARQEAASLKPSAALLKAQDYLQGRNGVKQDCDQGLAYLRAAVQRSEPAAAMQMGELYANGRCVQQDRVMAYRWMNSAREKAPGNPTIQMTVDQLWGRMTPQERKDAGR